MNKHRIIVLGAGYAGLIAAKRLAQRIAADQIAVTLVTAHPTLDERPRWHQVATGQKIPEFRIADLLRGSDVELRVSTAQRLDLSQKAIILAGDQRLSYDSLVVALGSGIETTSIPGVTEHARALTSRTAAEQIGRKLTGLAAGSQVVVCGGGLTGIEVATETAATFPDLTVSLVSMTPAGDWLSDRAKAHLTGAFERLGVKQLQARIVQVRQDAIELDIDSSATVDPVLASDLTIWCGGFRGNPLVEASDLQVDPSGRALVDESFHSVSHPDVWVIGDAAAIPGPWGASLKMGCRTAGFMGPALADSVTAALTGGELVPFRYRYLAENISLGRHDAIVQPLTRLGAPHSRVLTGRPAVWFKELTLVSATTLMRHSGPYRPARHVRIQAPVVPETIGV